VILFIAALVASSASRSFAQEKEEPWQIAQHKIFAKCLEMKPRPGEDEFLFNGRQHDCLAAAAEKADPSPPKAQAPAAVSQPTYHACYGLTHWDSLMGACMHM
jgi:hypothetical protein